MQLREADEILKKLARGRYRAIRFELGHYSSGDVKTQCEVYIDGGNWYTAPTFERALESLRTLGKSELEEEQEVDDAPISGVHNSNQQANPGPDPGGAKGEGG